MNPAQLNPGMVKNFLATIKILPRHIWQPREAQGDLVNFVETHPVGSGLYTLQNFSPESIILFRNDNYWGKTIFGLPVPRFVLHNIYTSNADILSALANAEVDMSQAYIPELWKLWEDQGLPIGTWSDQPPY